MPMSFSDDFAEIVMESKNKRRLQERDEISEIISVEIILKEERSSEEYELDWELEVMSAYEL